MVEFAALFGFVLMLGTFLMWSRRTISAAMIYILLGIMVAGGMVEMRSLPKPMNLEWRSPVPARTWPKESEVLWYRLEEGQALYFVLLMPAGPRFYVMPWDGDKAEQLLKAGQDAKDGGGTLKMARPFEPSLSESEPMFYALPQPVPAPKGS